MKNKKQILISSVISIVAIAFGGWYFYQNSQSQVEMNFEPIEDVRTEIVEETKNYHKSSVLINIISNKNARGSAYVVGKDTILTNKHVIFGFENKPEELIANVGHKNKDGKLVLKEFKIKKIIISDKEEHDVAVLHMDVSKDGEHIGDVQKIVEFADISKVKTGDNITVVGYPGDKKYGTLWESKGPITQLDGIVMFQALTAQGNSGSPIFNEEGKVIGMNNAGGENISFGFLMDKSLMDFITPNIK